MPKYCPSILSPALVPNEWNEREPSILVGSVFIGKRLGCLSYKSYSTVSTGQRRSHCPETNFSHYSEGLQGAATTGQLPCRQSISGKQTASSNREMCIWFCRALAPLQQLPLLFNISIITNKGVQQSIKSIHLILYLYLLF